MHAIRKNLALLTATLLAATSAFGAEPDYRAMLRDHDRRMHVLAGGVKSLPPLLQIAIGKDAGLAAEAERMVRWLAVRACDTPADREAMTKALLETADKAPDLAVRKLAVAVLPVCGRDDAVPLLAAMLNKPDLGAVAAESLAQVPGEAASKALADAFAQAKGPQQVMLGKALASRRDPATVAVVTTMFNDEALREIAFESLVHTPGNAAAKEMASALDKAEPMFRAKLLRALGQRRSRLVLAPALKLAKGADEPQRVAAIEALGRLANPVAATIVRDATTSDSQAIRAAALTATRRLADALLVAGKRKEAAAMFAHVLAHATLDRDRIAALGGLARAAQPATIAAIVPLLAKGDYRVRLSAVHALHAIPAPEATAAIRKALALPDARVRCALLGALAERRDPSAVPDIVAVAPVQDDAVRIAAMNALAALPSPAAESVIRTALTKGSPDVKTAAALAYLALGNALLGKGDKAKALSIYHAILEAKVAQEPIVGALAGVERIASKDSAPLVAPHLKGKRAVRNAAAKAHLAIAATLAAQGDRPLAKAMLTTILTLKPPAACSPDAALKLRAIGAKVDVPATNGVVSHWWIIGAWSADQSQWAVPRFPEKEVNLLKAYTIGKRRVQWKPVQGKDADGAVMLDTLLAPSDKAVAYAYAELHVAAESAVVFEIASDDGCVLWLNGKKVYEHLEPRSWGTPPDSVKAHLTAGANRLLLKACEGSGSWGFRLRLTDAAGKPLAFKMR